MGEDVAVGCAARYQLLVRALVFQFPAAQHENAVGPTNLRKAVRDKECRPAAQDVSQRALNLVLRRAVNRTGGVIQDEDARIGQEGTGNGDPLALSAGERYAPFAYHGVVPVFEAHDEIVGLGLFRHGLNLLAAYRPAHAKGDVLCQRA